MGHGKAGGAAADFRNALKAATRAQVEKSGGYDFAAGHVTRVGRSQLHRCGDRNSDQFLTIDDAMRLMADSGALLLLEAMAGQFGHVLLDLSPGGADTVVAQDLARFGEEAARVFADYAAAVAPGSNAGAGLDAAERDRLDAGLERVVRVVMAARAHLRDDAGRADDKFPEARR